MAVPFWDKDPDAYDTLMIGVSGGNQYIFAETSVEVSGEVSNGKWDIKEAQGTDGARETYRGYTPSKITVTWHVYTEEHWLDYQALVKDIQIRASKSSPKPIEVSHPDLDVYRLKKFHIEGLPIIGKPNKGIREAKVKIFEWFEQPKPSPKPAAAASSGMKSMIVPDRKAASDEHRRAGAFWESKAGDSKTDKLTTGIKKQVND